MGPQGPTKENAQLTRQNDISFTLFKLVYCLAREYFSVTVWFIKCVHFFKNSQKDITLPKQLGVASPGTQALYFWRPILLKKCQKSQIPRTPPFLC